MSVNTISIWHCRGKSHVCHRRYHFRTRLSVPPAEVQIVIVETPQGSDY